MKLDDFYPHVVPLVDQLPLPMIELQVRTAANTFFTRTHAWQVDHDPITAKADTTSYDLDAPTGAELVKLMAVTGESGFSLMERVGLVEGTQLSFNWSAPQPGDTIKVRLAVAPAVNTIGSAWAIPDHLKPYCEAIAFGALAALLKSEDYRAKFEARIHRVGLKVAREFASGRMSRKREWTPF